MNKITSTILFFLVFTTIFSQNNKKNILKNFDKTGMETSILYQKSPIIDIQQYNDKTINMYGFYQVYKDLFQYDFEKRYASLNNIKQKTKQSYFDNIIPLSIIHSDYETIKISALKNHKVFQSTNGYLMRENTSDNIFEKQSITVASPLRIRQKGLQTTFKLSSDDIYDTSNNKISIIKIDFSDNLGFRSIDLDKNIEVNYTDAGTKELIFQLTFEDGSIKTTRSKLDVRYSNKDMQTLFNRVVNTFTASITPDLSVYGEATSYPGEGEYEIFMSTESGAVLDKPLIIVDGFDPTDGRPITGYTDATTGNYVSGIYDLLDFDNNGTPSNLGDLIRAEGFDVVILNFPEYTRAADGALVDGGSDYIERNAMLLVELINTLNAQKTGTDPNVIIGPSMGGLISRYALNYMENQSLNHDTRLWLSFDSPHHGANVPIGFQHQFNFLAYGLDDFSVIGNMNVVELQPIIDGMLKSPAARQMLVDQFEAHLDPTANRPDVDFDPAKNLPQKHSFNPIFYNRLNALTTSGFPENLRKISIINGSGVNSRYKDKQNNDIMPGHLVVDANFEVDATSSADLIATVNFTPSAGTESNVSNVHIDFPWWFALANDRYASANSKAFPYSDGVDAASGGLFDIGALTANLGTTGTVGNYLAALQTDYFNFIPSVSAMALEITNSEIDWFHAPTNLTTARAVNNVTPFDAWYMPTNNEPHVTVTQPNFQFAWDEIVLSVLNNNTFELNNNYQLLGNPISDNTIKISNKSISAEKIDANIYNLTGQKVYQQTIQNPDNHIEIPINLSAGIYILELNDTESTYKTKIIVK